MLPAVLVNPRRAVGDARCVRQIRKREKGDSLADVPRGFDALIEFLKQHDNDLTPAAIACAPVVGEVLIALQALPGVRLARMSGSGPTCFALFAAQGEAANAAQKLGDQRKDWWIRSATIGSAFGES